MKSYTERISAALAASPFMQLNEVRETLLAARNAGKWIFTAGNGGSAATASHFNNDMVKGLSVLSTSGPSKIRFKSMALCDALPVVTALANDYDYNMIYAEQLKNFASDGDVFVVFSGSGNSPNVVKAAELSVATGLKVIAFTGGDGGRIADIADICCVADTGIMEEIEDIHMVWCHALITDLRKNIAAEAQ